MGGKKGPEKNRKYEKDRRDRFNDQFDELNKLLPDFNSSAMKVTKAEIITRTIQFLKNNQSKSEKLAENESSVEVSENKINELQKKVAGLLQIIKELIKLLHKANINFPASLPVDDFKSFKEAYMKCRRKLRESSVKEKQKKNAISKSSNENLSPVSENESIGTEEEDSVKSPFTVSSATKSPSTVPENSTCVVSESRTVCGAQIVNVNSSNILRVNTNPVIIPQGNLLAVNGLPNALLNSVNASPTILLNKQVAVPTVILMQNNIVPVSTVQPIDATTQEKLIVPKAAVNTTKTTFINKKPIPAVRPYKSIMPSTDISSKIQLLKRKRSRRSKGILVKYPKRKPPSKKKVNEKQIKTAEELSPSTSKNAGKPVVDASLESCNAALNSFPESNDVIGKNYSDNLFGGPDIQNTGPFIDFFGNTARNVNNNTNSANSTCVNRAISSESNVSCNLINTDSSKEPEKESKSKKGVDYLPATSYPDAENDVRTEDSILVKRKCAEKDIAPLAVQCDLDENKSIAKDLNLTFDDKTKHYESSFDEFSNDLFLHVPSSGQHADSISPTAAFLSNFPLVSSLKNTDLLPEHEEDSNATPTNSTTILQIGNLGSPSTLLYTNKNASSREAGKNSDKEDSYAFCNSTSELENRAEKKKDSKEPTPRDVFNLDTFINQSTKNTPCSKEVVTQNIHPYPTSTSSSFPTYSRLTKYNDIPAVTGSYYSFSSPPTFPLTKTSSDLGTDYNSWIPAYNQEDANKEKKRDKSTSTSSRNTFGLPVNEPVNNSSEKSKSKKPKQNNSRALVNWMTSPDSRNATETLQPFSDIFSSTKDDTAVSSIAFLNSPNVQNTTNFTSYSSTDYFLDNQSYGDTQLGNKLPYSSTNPTSYSWSPSKTTLPTLTLETPNMMIPSTLPTLVGDLALGNNNTFNNYDSGTKKNDADKKKTYHKTPTAQNASSFLSVTQLMDGKSMSKKYNDHCHYDENRDKCYKENYSANKSNENGVEYKKTYSSATCKENAKNQSKCRKEAMKCNTTSNQANRYLSKENKKDHKPSQKLYEYSSQSCQMMANKETNPLSNKNSNYSAEALIASNTCSSQNYFSYDNSTSYNNCPTNKKLDETDSLSNVGYYPNTNYMYPNNFQTFNNYSFPNQYCNNYTTQVQHNSFQKKKDEGQQSKQDTDWYKDSFSSSYSAMVPSEFASQQKEKCKQSFANKYNGVSKGSAIYNSYYQYGSSATSLNHSKHSCNFNTTSDTFSQTGLQCAANNCQAPGYDTKLSRHEVANTNNVVPPTTLTNFNLSTIIPEINDKHCMQPRVNTVENEKNNFKYGAANEMNYNYLIQPTSESNPESTSTVYGSSSFQISHYPEFVSRKHHK